MRRAHGPQGRGYSYSFAILPPRIVILSVVEGSLKLLAGDLPAPGQNFGFRAGGFGFLDVAGAIVK
jgi:hypothetical protein